MSSDNAAAAFFANRKKKKKGFKFNANKVDVSQIASSTHVDAPQLSEVTNSTVGDPVSISTGANTGGDWDESALSAKMKSSTITSTTGGAKISVDMKTAFESQRNEKEEIKEKLRVEETRKQLAAAREGMKKEEEKAKEEREAKKKQQMVGAGSTTGSRFGVAAGNMAGGAGSKWVPKTPRFSAGAGLGRPTSSYQRQVNTNDEELFPDLATADKMIKQEEEKQNAAKAAAAKPSISPWGSQKKSVPEKKEEKVDEVKKEPVVTEQKKETVTPSAAAAATTNGKAAAPVTTAASVAAGLKKKPKKKKKDLSTFKAS